MHTHAPVFRYPYGMPPSPAANPALTQAVMRVDSTTSTIAKSVDRVASQVDEVLAILDSKSPTRRRGGSSRRRIKGRSHRRSKHYL